MDNELSKGARLPKPRPPRHVLLVSSSFALLVLAALGCSSEGPVDARHDFPATWPTATPESQGLDSDALADAIDWAREGDFGLHALTILRHHQRVLDACFWP